MFCLSADCWHRSYRDIQMRMLCIPRREAWRICTFVCTPLTPEHYTVSKKHYTLLEYVHTAWKPKVEAYKICTSVFCTFLSTQNRESNRKRSTLLYKILKLRICPGTLLALKNPTRSCNQRWKHYHRSLNSDDKTKWKTTWCAEIESSD